MLENILFATNKTFPPGSKLHQQPTDKKRNKKNKNLSLESEKKTYAEKKNKINKNNTLTKSYHKQNPPNRVCVCVHVYFATESNLRFSRVDHLTQWLADGGGGGGRLALLRMAEPRSTTTTTNLSLSQSSVVATAHTRIPEAKRML